MPNRIRTAVEAMQPEAPKTDIDHARADAAREQLLASDHAVLAGCDGGDGTVFAFRRKCGHVSHDPARRRFSTPFVRISVQPATVGCCVACEGEIAGH
jgi:hypothetical protein